MSPTDTPRVSALHQSPTSTVTHSLSDHSSATYRPDPQLSTSHLLVAHVGAALALFLATTDATILSTSLPTVTESLDASSIEYTWIAVSYLLTQTVFQPLYGKVSDMIGRKVVCHLSILIFAVGSLLCGSAQTTSWLITARALAGVGGGGIVACVWVITAEIVPPDARPKWSQALSITWSCSAVAGPLLGGLFSSGTLGWRWIFYLNLPICAAASVLLAWSLRHVTLARSGDVNLRNIVASFDFAGLILFLIASCALMVGFTLAAPFGWSSPLIICLIVGGLLTFIGGAWHEIRTTRDALFPRSLFRDQTSMLLLALVFLHNFAFNAGTYYLSLFYQAVGGRTPMEAGIQLLPYSLGSSLASMPAAWIIQHVQEKRQDTLGQKAVMFTGLLLATLGFGLMHLMTTNSTIGLQVAIALIAGIGIGALFHAPYQVFSNRHSHDLASITGAFFLVRFTGSTVGLSIASAVFNSELARHPLNGISTDTLAAQIGWHNLRTLQPPAAREHVLSTVVRGMRTVWTLCAACLGVALLISALLRVSSLAAVAIVSTDAPTRPASELTDCSKTEVHIVAEKT